MAPSVSRVGIGPEALQPITEHGWKEGLTVPRGLENPCEQRLRQTRRSGESKSLGTAVESKEFLSPIF